MSELLAQLAAEDFEQREQVKNLLEVMVFDKDMNLVANLTGAQIEDRYRRKWNQVGSIRLAFRPDDRTREAFSEVHPDAAIPIVTVDNGKRLVWFVTNVDEFWSRDDADITVNAVSPEKFLEHVRLWSDPLLPAEAQVSREQIAIGPVATVVKFFWLGPNLSRLQGNFWKLPDGNLLDPRSWNPIAQTMSPHLVAPTIRQDASKWTALTVAFDEALDSISDLLSSHGLTLTTRLYLHGVDEQPFPLMPLTRTTLIWDVEERADAPAVGALVAGVGRTISDLVQSIGNVVTAPIISPSANNEREYKDFWARPKMVIRQGEYESCRTITEKPSASTYTVGGRAPEWLNKLIQSGVKSAMLAASGPWSVVMQQPLDIGAFEAVVDDRVATYHSFYDRARATRAGRWRFHESFKGSTTALTLSAVSEILMMQWKSKSNRGYEVELSAGYPLIPGVDYDIGDYIAVETPDGNTFLAYVTVIEREMRENGDVVYTVTISEKPVNSPSERLLSHGRSVANIVNKVAFL